MHARGVGPGRAGVGRVAGGGGAAPRGRAGGGRGGFLARRDAACRAAGRGPRLRPHTLTTPKPLLPVRGRPILDWSLGALPSEVRRVLVVVHYLAEQVEAYL